MALASTRQPHSRGPASVQAHRTGGVTGSEGQEGANGVGGGIGVGGGNGDGDGDVNGHGDEDGAGTGTGVEVNEGAQDGNGDRSEDGAGTGTGTGVETRRRTPDGNGDGNGDGSEDSAGEGRHGICRMPGVFARRHDEGPLWRETLGRSLVSHDATELVGGICHGNGCRQEATRFHAISCTKTRWSSLTHNRVLHQALARSLRES